MHTLRAGTGTMRSRRDVTPHISPYRQPRDGPSPRPTPPPAATARARPPNQGHGGGSHGGGQGGGQGGRGGETATSYVTIPPDAAPGQVLYCPGPDGVMYAFPVPAGARPGQTVKF